MTRGGEAALGRGDRKCKGGRWDRALSACDLRAMGLPPLRPPDHLPPVPSAPTSEL